MTPEIESQDRPRSRPQPSLPRVRKGCEQTFGFNRPSEPEAQTALRVTDRPTGHWSSGADATRLMGEAGPDDLSGTPCDLRSEGVPGVSPPRRGPLDIVVVQFPESTKEPGRGAERPRPAGVWAPPDAVSSAGGASSERPRPRSSSRRQYRLGDQVWRARRLRRGGRRGRSRMTTDGARVGRTPSCGPHTAASFRVLGVSGRGRGQDRPLAPNGQLGVPWGWRPGLVLPSPS